jgi:hypothetical protein
VTGCATTQRLLGMGHLAMATVKKSMNAQLVRVQVKQIRVVFLD